ncbi:tRNA (N(6)-L-threonylcarbamoyladenosine(37)-C(2))-methylthiotransferase MtaB [bacterium AH-315-J19]|nr:tRNA (N(6)-L-threonylcarbamoyladenosine(37)-C(2))-methylthiotransferase MtaB [Robiginitomaculum sp.]MBN4058463.1 tRNA (N(6)-L-threonylcarbamoyladenosine(37)-C(2))-methylthiotransferase MtaB [bacterium AH-315-J19]
MATDVKSITLGCRLNLRESEVMAAHARAQKLGEAVIINTCAVTNEAARQSRQAVRRAVREHKGAKIIVTGCAAQIEPEVFKALDGVERVLGNSEKMRQASFASNAKSKVSDIMQSRDISLGPVGTASERSRAIVQVQTGCDHRCTFCIIPYGRGNSRSVPASEVAAQVRELSENGFNEVVLSGVDISSWGDDLPGTPKLGQLVSDILEAAPALPRLRLSSIDPAEVDEKLFELMATEPRLTPYLHLSLQHGDNMILKRMKRRHTREQAIKLCADLRRVRPDISFGADIIAGFPTETEEMFENSRKVIDECGLAWLHVFPFSARSGTPAARMPLVDGKVIKARAKILREAGAQAQERFLASRDFGHDLALIEKGGLGRLADFSPVKLPAHNAPSGQLRTVKITGYSDGKLLGELV